jgi:hypothetical protein
MVLQSITILVILVYVNYRPWLLSHELEPAARWLRNGFIWATLVVTIASSVVYVRRAVELFKNK